MYVLYLRRCNEIACSVTRKSEDEDEDEEFKKKIIKEKPSDA